MAESINEQMKKDLRKAIEVLQQGGVVLYPTDTVWGLGCDATNKEAVKRIYRIKRREERKSMLILVASVNDLPLYVKEVPPMAYELIRVNDQPMTLVYPGAQNLAENLIAEDGSIGIRIPMDEFCLQLLQRFGKPVVSTSANFSGNPAPAIFREIPEEIKKAVDYVVSWRQNDPGKRKPSSVIKIGLKGEIEIIRE